MLKTYRSKSDDVEESKPCMALLLPEQVGVLSVRPGCVIGFLGVVEKVLKGYERL